MPAAASWKVEALGDRAVLVTCRDEATAQQVSATIRALGWPGIYDVVVSYHSLAVYVDTARMTVSKLLPHLERLKLKSATFASKVHTIPCCYELGEDLDLVCKQLKLTKAEVIEKHSATVFTVYAIGFSPGFPYLGWLPKALQGIARRPEPRLKVPAGSVAIVGKQSAIYPQATPGGWALIGRTPKTVVDIASGYFPLAVGDQLRFEPMELKAYEAWK